MLTIAAFVKEVTPYISTHHPPNEFPETIAMDLEISVEISYPLLEQPSPPFVSVPTSPPSQSPPPPLTSPPPPLPSSTLLSSSSLPSPSSSSLRPPLRPSGPKRPTDNTGGFFRAVFKLAKQKGLVQKWRQFRKAMCARRGCVNPYLKFCEKMGGEFVELMRQPEFRKQGSRNQCNCLNNLV